VSAGGEIGVPGALVIHPGALGDVLLSVPALRAIRHPAPGVPVRLGAQPRIGGLLARLGVVDEAIAFEGLGLEALFIDDGQPPKAAVLERARRVVCWFGARDQTFVSRLRQVVPDAIVASPRPEDDGAEVWRILLRSIGGDGEADFAPVPVPARLDAEGRAALLDAGWDGAAPLLMVHPGAGGAAKRWPADGFGRLADEIAVRDDLRIVVHEGPADADAVAAFTARLRGRLLRLIDPPLPVLAGALRHVRLFVGNDSGVSHIAAAVGAPSLVLFAAANLAWRPWCPAARPLVVGMHAVEAGDLETALAAAHDLITKRGP
jgi:ADP-heptose:LPS heptosyltransferase